MAAARPSSTSIRCEFDSHLRSSHFQWDRSLVEPNANARAERWGTVRAECLDWTLVRGRRHLERVLCEYVAYYGRKSSLLDSSPLRCHDARGCG